MTRLKAGATSDGFNVVLDALAASWTVCLTRDPNPMSRAATWQASGPAAAWNSPAIGRRGAARLRPPSVRGSARHRDRRGLPPSALDGTHVAGAGRRAGDCRAARRRRSAIDDAQGVVGARRARRAAPRCWTRSATLPSPHGMPDFASAHYTLRVSLAPVEHWFDGDIVRARGPVAATSVPSVPAGRHRRRAQAVVPARAAGGRRDPGALVGALLTGGLRPNAATSPSGRAVAYKAARARRRPPTHPCVRGDYIPIGAAPAATGCP